MVYTGCLHDGEDTEDLNKGLLFSIGWLHGCSTCSLKDRDGGSNALPAMFNKMTELSKCLGNV